MNNVSLLPFAGIVIGGYCGSQVYDHLVMQAVIAPPSIQKMLLMLGGGAFIGLVLGYLAMVKLESD